MSENEEKSGEIKLNGEIKIEMNRGIYKMENFTDLEAKEVLVFTRVDAMAPNSVTGPLKQFRGRTFIREHEQAQPRPLIFNFDKESTVEECFASFNEKRDAVIADMIKKSQEQSKVIPAGRLPNGMMPMPRGPKR